MAYRKDLDHSCFDELTRSALYWCGILATDGNVQFAKNSPSITFASVDVDHVENFKRFVKAEHPIAIIRKRTNFRIENLAFFRFCSGRIGSVLAANGIGPRKSLTIEVSTKFAESADFWRGALDGDGSIIRDHSGRLHIGLCSGSRTFVDQFASFIGKHVERPQVTVRSKDRKNHLYIVRVSGTKAKLLANVLYQDAADFLSRKKRAAEEAV